MHCQWIPFLLLSLTGSLTSCATDNSFAQQQAWLERNYPDRSRSLSQLPHPPSHFQRQVIAGEIVNGMRLEEVLIATDAYPYGPRPVQQVFWCGEEEVTACDSTCNICNAVIITRKLAVLLSSSGSNHLLQTTEHRFRGEKESIALYQGIHFSLAKDTFHVFGARNTMH